ncbi:MAG: hypothetical protein K0Q85_62 [Caproiciproducens sp.]|nr:hypothetical protein [Caproiciproducens sp.]
MFETGLFIIGVIVGFFIGAIWAGCEREDMMDENIKLCVENDVLRGAIEKYEQR